MRNLLVSPWQHAAGVKYLKAVLKNINASAGFRSQVLIQTADVRPSAPNAPSTLGSTLTGSDEMCTGSVDVSTTLADASWFRLGVAHDLASGTDAQADVELTAIFERCAQVLGAGSYTLVATSTTVQRMPVSGWLPAETSAKVDLAAVTSGLSGNFQWKLVCRMAETSKEDPGAWESVGDSLRSSDGEDCATGMEPSAPGPNMWIQYAIEYSLSTSGSPGQATIDLVLAVRKP